MLSTKTNTNDFPATLLSSTSLSKLGVAGRPLSSVPPLALEPRYMFDAAGVATGVEAAQDAESEKQARTEGERLAETLTRDSGKSERERAQEAAERAGPPGAIIVFVDRSVEGYESLIAGLAPNVEVIYFNPDQNGLVQMALTLEGRREIAAVHVISHGGVGSLRLGDGLLSLDNLADYKEALAAIRASLSEDGDLLLYGCNVGADGEGRAFVEALAKALDADVAASDDLTGDRDQGGDWELETEVGQIESDVIVAAEAREAYDGVLASRNWSAPVFVEKYTKNGKTKYKVVKDRAFSYNVDKNGNNKQTPKLFESKHKINFGNAGKGGFLFDDDSGNMNFFHTMVFKISGASTNDILRFDTYDNRYKKTTKHTIELNTQNSDKNTNEKWGGDWKAVKSSLKMGYSKYNIETRKVNDEYQIRIRMTWLVSSYHGSQYKAIEKLVQSIEYESDPTSTSSDTTKTIVFDLKDANKKTGGIGETKEMSNAMTVKIHHNVAAQLVYDNDNQQEKTKKDIGKKNSRDFKNGIYLVDKDKFYLRNAVDGAAKTKFFTINIWAGHKTNANGDKIDKNGAPTTNPNDAVFNPDGRSSTDQLRSGTTVLNIGDKISLNGVTWTYSKDSSIPGIDIDKFVASGSGATKAQTEALIKTLNIYNPDKANGNNVVDGDASNGYKEPGQIHFNFKFTDTGGLKSLPSKTILTVDAVGPMVTGAEYVNAPQHNVYGPNMPLELKVTFDEKVVLDTSKATTVTLLIGGKKVKADYVSGGGMKTLTFKVASLPNELYDDDGIEIIKFGDGLTDDAGNPVMKYKDNLPPPLGPDTSSEKQSVDGTNNILLTGASFSPVEPEVDTTGPQIINIAAFNPDNTKASGKYVENKEIKIVVTLDEKMPDGGKMTVTLDTGDKGAEGKDKKVVLTRSTDTSDPDYKKKFIGTYTVEAGHTSPDLTVLKVELGDTTTDTVSGAIDNNDPNVKSGLPFYTELDLLESNYDENVKKTYGNTNIEWGNLHQLQDVVIKTEAGKVHNRDTEKQNQGPETWYGDDGSLKIKVVFTENVTLSKDGEAQITLMIGGKKVIAKATGTGTSNDKLVFTVEKGAIPEGVLDDDGIEIVKNSLKLTKGTLKDTGNQDVNTKIEEISLKNIRVDAKPPAITEITSTSKDGTYKVDDEIDITVTVDEDMPDGSQIEVTLDTGETVILTRDPSDKKKFNGGYTVTDQKKSKDLTVTKVALVQTLGKEARDAYGNDLDVTLPSGNNLGDNKDIKVDAKGPEIERVLAERQSYKKGEKLRVTVEFDEEIFVVGPEGDNEKITVMGLWGGNVVFERIAHSALPTFSGFNPANTNGPDTVNPDLPVYKATIGGKDWYIWARKSTQAGVEYEHGYHISQANAAGTTWYWEVPSEDTSTTPPTLWFMGSPPKEVVTWKSRTGVANGTGQPLTEKPSLVWASAKRKAPEATITLLIDGQEHEARFIGKSGEKGLIFEVVLKDDLVDRDSIEVKEKGLVLTKTTLGDDQGYGFTTNEKEIASENRPNIDTKDPSIVEITSSSANGTYTVGDVIDIIITVDEDMADSSRLVVTLDTGAVVILTRDPNDPTKFTGKYAVEANHRTKDLTVNKIELVKANSAADLVGNALRTNSPTDENLGDNKDIVIDITPPPASRIVIFKPVETRVKTRVAVARPEVQRSNTTIQMNQETPETTEPRSLAAGEVEPQGVIIRETVEDIRNVLEPAVLVGEKILTAIKDIRNEHAKAVADVAVRARNLVSAATGRVFTRETRGPSAEIGGAAPQREEFVIRPSRTDVGETPERPAPEPEAQPERNRTPSVDLPEETPVPAEQVEEEQSGLDLPEGGFRESLRLAGRIESIREAGLAQAMAEHVPDLGAS